MKTIEDRKSENNLLTNFYKWLTEQELMEMVSFLTKSSKWQEAVESHFRLSPDKRHRST